MKRHISQTIPWKIHPVPVPISEQKEVPAQTPAYFSTKSSAGRALRFPSSTWGTSNPLTPHERVNHQIFCAGQRSRQLVASLTLTDVAKAFNTALPNPNFHFLSLRRKTGELTQEKPSESFNSSTVGTARLYHQSLADKISHWSLIMRRKTNSARIFKCSSAIWTLPFDSSVS